MKMLSICLLLISGGFFAQDASAQVRIGLGVNIGSQPVWGPTGYDHAEYYYIPQYDVYYDVPRHRYIYWEGGRRVFATNLPGRFHDADFYHSYKVVLNEPHPYMHHDEHVRQYSQYREHHDQAVIRDSHESKYWEIRDHPEHGKWHGRDHDRDHDRH